MSFNYGHRSITISNQLKSCMSFPAPTRKITEEEVKPIAEGLIEELRLRAFEAEKARRVPTENIALFAKAGLLQVLQQAHCGGQQLSLRAHVDAMATIARGCNATAWVLGVNHAHSWMLGHFPPQAQQEVFGDGGSEAMAAVIGPRGRAVRKTDGGYTLSGFWPFASGNAASRWLLLGAEIFDQDENKLDDGDFLVPISDVQVLDDWHVAGLQGTGRRWYGHCTAVERSHPASPRRPLVEQQP
jgi:3-hydroxy-9,10-secoandrosta-1,3,5(10)-triene-9,17-dione monooxygenase